MILSETQEVHLGEENIITITEISLLVKKKNSGKWEGLHGLSKASNSGCRWLTCVCVCVSRPMEICNSTEKLENWIYQFHALFQGHRGKTRTNVTYPSLASMKTYMPRTLKKDTT